MAHAEQNALISVYNKDGIVEFAQGLSDMDWHIYASGGTARKIAESDVPVKDVSELVGGEAILGHRVVTLSREVHAGLLASGSPEDTQEIADLLIPRLDLVCVDMYPLKEAIKKENATEESVTENTDIGGPTMLRSAAKGRRIVLSRPEQRNCVLQWLREERPDEATVLRVLAATAEREVAEYVTQSADYLGQLALSSESKSSYTTHLKDILFSNGT